MSDANLAHALRKLVSEPDCVEFPKCGVYGPIDRDAPFWSEGALYELVGKEAARSLLAWRRAALEALSSHERGEPRPAPAAPERSSHRGPQRPAADSHRERPARTDRSEEGRASIGSEHDQ